MFIQASMYYGNESVKGLCRGIMATKLNYWEPAWYKNTKPNTHIRKFANYWEECLWNNSNKNGNKLVWSPRLIHKQLEIVGCLISIVSTDGLVLQHQAIIINNANDMVCDIHFTASVWYKRIISTANNIKQLKLLFPNKKYPVVNG